MADLISWKQVKAITTRIYEQAKPKYVTLSRDNES